jgi:hypothetical protein
MSGTIASARTTALLRATAARIVAAGTAVPATVAQAARALAALLASSRGPRNRVLP